MILNNGKIKTDGSHRILGQDTNFMSASIGDYLFIPDEEDAYQIAKIIDEQRILLSDVPGQILASSNYFIVDSYTPYHELPLVWSSFREPDKYQRDVMIKLDAIFNKRIT